jgi:hypothetical protein
MMQEEQQPDIEIEVLEQPEPTETLIQWNITEPIIINQNPKTNMETTNNEVKVTPAKVEVIKYSERAIALKGEGTKQIKDQLKALGGKFNRYLKSDNGQFAGWIFSVKRQNEVTELLKMKGV